MTDFEPPDYHVAVNMVNFLQDRIASWASSKLPNRSLNNDVQKLVAEQAELLVKWYEDGIIDPLEVADIAIVLFCICDLAGISLYEAVIQKLDILERRKYAYDSEKGIWQRTEDAGIEKTSAASRIREACTKFVSGTYDQVAVAVGPRQEEGKNFRCAHGPDWHSKATHPTLPAGIYCSGCHSYCSKETCEYSASSGD